MKLSATHRHVMIRSLRKSIKDREQAILYHTHLGNTLMIQSVTRQRDEYREILEALQISEERRRSRTR